MAAEPAWRATAWRWRKDALSRARWDLVLVIDRTLEGDAAEKAKAAREEVYRRLGGAGLLAIPRKAPGGLVTYILLTAPLARLEAEAERVKIHKRVAAQPSESIRRAMASARRQRGNSDLAEGYLPFSRAHASVFEPASDHFFTSMERQRLVFSIVEADPADGGAGLNPESLVDSGFADLTPLSMASECRLVQQRWLSCSLLPTPPVFTIRDYLGEQYALACEFQAVYTRWLGMLSVASAGAAGAQAALGVDNVLVPFYCCALAVWCTLLLEAWKRRQAELAFIWGTAPDVESARPEFERLDGVRKAPGCHSRRGFVAMDAAPTTSYLPTSLRLVRMSAAVSGSVFFLLVVLCGTVSIAALRLFLGNVLGDSDPMPMIVGALCNSIFIAIMNFVWRPVARTLTRFEGHRTQRSFDDALTTKTFAFLFVNHYSSLYWIAFVQSTQIPLLGLRVNGDLLRYEQCPSFPGGAGEMTCMEALFVQLVVLVVSRQVVRQVIVAARYSLLPRVVELLRASLLATRRRRHLLAGSVVGNRDEALDRLAAWCADDLRKPPHGGSDEEMQEMVVQFGYVTLFACAFPLAALVCFATNLVEARTDAHKVLRVCRRPRARGAADIGVWQDILAFLSMAAVLTNAMLLFVTSNALQQTFPDLSAESRLLVIITVEHAVLVLKAAVAEAIPDVPAWVVHQRAAHYGALRRRARASRSKAAVTTHLQQLPPGSDVVLRELLLIGGDEGEERRDGGGGLAVPLQARLELADVVGDEADGVPRLETADAQANGQPRLAVRASTGGRPPGPPPTPGEELSRGGGQGARRGEEV